MNKITRKILGWVIALIVIIFPFRRAFLYEEQPDIMMILSFVVVLIGIGLFFYLTSDTENDTEH